MSARTHPARLRHPLLDTLGLLVAASGATLAGQGTTVDWNPTVQEVVLDTEVTRINTSIGPVTVRGGASNEGETAAGIFFERDY